MSGSQQLFYRAIVKTIILYSIGSDQQAAELTCGDQRLVPWQPFCRHKKRESHLVTLPTIRVHLLNRLWH
jgi:hypothetical protein